jgi:hypothetical protein
MSTERLGFGVVFGAVMLVAVVRFLAQGWVQPFYGEPSFFFRFYGFGWVPLLPPAGVTALYALLAVLAAMVTAGEYRIAKIVAVWRDERGVPYVLPPCGRCREFIRQIDPGNLDTEVLLGRDRSTGLRELLPFHEWPEPLN